MPRLDGVGLPRRTFDFARAPPSRVVLELKPPAPTEPGACRAPHGRAAWAGVYPKGQRGFSTRLAHCSGGPPSAALLATSAPGRLLSTGLLSVLYFRVSWRCRRRSGKYRKGQPPPEASRLAKWKDRVTQLDTPRN